MRIAVKIDHPQFIAMLRQRFPDVAEVIDDCSAGLLHLEVAALGRATIEAVRDGDVKAVMDHFAFADEVYRYADAAVENAINVCYLEHIDFERRKAKAIKARELLTPRLRQAVKELEEYQELLGRSPMA
jgi:hypothetical protein